ncbi:MAG: GtrA family protein [Muribaculaceae bacterium]|nr:GtrA family protein [Muribaculaceae bacterium]
MKLKKVHKLISGKGRLSEIIRFGIVGGFASLLQFSIYLVFVDIVELAPEVSTIVSYVISFVFNFILSHYFTFQSKPNAKKGFGFVASHLINMGMQTGLVAIFSRLIGDSFALLPAMAICIPCNYLMVRFALTNRHFESKKRKNYHAE